MQITSFPINIYTKNTDASHQAADDPTTHTNRKNKDSEQTRLTPETNPSEENKRNQDGQEQKEAQNLTARDREVRAHEAAHLAAAGRYAIGGANFTYKQGPDGVSYAVGGEVNIDTAPVPGDPEETLEKAQTIQRAALAPADPSSQDRAVAAKAAQMAAKARAEIMNQSGDESEEKGKSASLSPAVKSYQETAELALDNEKTKQETTLEFTV
jgi:hypothetical protein